MKRSEMISLSKIIPILLIPILYLFLCLYLKCVTGPFYLGTNSDPSYLYLMSSVYILDGLTPGFIQHPGIPLHFLGAGIIKIFHLFSNSDAIVEAIYRNPEFYLHAIYYVVVVVNVLACFAIGWYVAEKLNNVPAGLLSQTSSLLVVNWNSSGVLNGDIPVAANVNAENFLVAVTSVYGLLIFKMYMDEKARSRAGSRNFAMGFGLLASCGFMTKLLFFPWVLVPFLLLSKWKDRIVFVLIFILGTVLWAIPVREKIPQVLPWFIGALTHTGTHGGGERGWIDWTMYSHGLARYLKENIFYFLVVGGAGTLALLSLRGQFKNLDSIARRYLLVLCCTIVLCVLLMSRQPYAHYIVPTLNFFGLVCLFAFLTWKLQDDRGKIKFVVFWVAAMIMANIGWAARLGTGLGVINRDIKNFSQKVYSDYADCTVCGYYRSSSVAFALQFGDENQGHRAYVDTLQRIYPGTVFYHYWNRYFYDGKDTVPYESLYKRSPCILLYGSILNEKFNEGFIKVSELARSQSEGLYKIERVTADDALKALMLAKKFESARKYREAYILAQEAKALGLSKLDPYINNLRKNMNELNQ